ncbi:MAG: tetratricopeptide repeat protein [Acidobacteriota bacterium]
MRSGAQSAPRAVDESSPPAVLERTTLAALVLLSAACVLVTTFRDLDSDLFWHLKCGYDILDSGSIGRVDVYSYTATGASFINHEWLSEVFLALLHWLGGFDAIVIAKAFICACLLLMVARGAQARGAGGISIAWCALYALLLSRWRLFAKPELAAFYFVLLFDTIATQYLRRGDRRYLAWLPPLALVWANTHLYVAVGILVLLIHAIGEAVGRGFLGRDGGRGSPRFLGLIAAACAAVSLINPLGPRLYLPAIQIYTSSSLRLSMVMEWMPPTYSGFPLFFLLAIPATCILLVTLRRAPLQDVALWAGTMVLAFRSCRHIELFALVSAPILARQLGWALDGLKRWTARVLPAIRPSSDPKLRLLLFAATLLWAVTTLLSHHHSLLHQDASRQFIFGTGLDRRAIPDATVDLVESRALKGPLYNSYDLGGYLIWRCVPRLKVFIDGRHTMYEGLLEWIETHRAREMLDHFGIQLAIVSYRDPLALAALRADPRFRLVCYDDASMLFLRSPTPEGTVIPYRYLRPEDLSFSWFGELSAEAREAAHLEARRAVREAPGSSRAWALLGRISRRTGDRPEAVDALLRAVRLDPSNMPLRNELGTAYMEAGLLVDALEQFREAAAMNPGAASSYHNQGLVLYRLGEDAAALRAFKQAVRCEGHSEEAYLFLGLLEQDRAAARSALLHFLRTSTDSGLRRQAEQRLKELDH